MEVYIIGVSCCNLIMDGHWVNFTRFEGKKDFNLPFNKSKGFQTWGGESGSEPQIDV